MTKKLSSATSQSEATIPLSLSRIFNISAQLKFFIKNIWSTVQTTLTVDTNQIWRSQIIKLFSANVYDCFLLEESKCQNLFLLSEGDDDIPNPDYKKWNLIYQNLALALYSIISSLMC